MQIFEFQFNPKQKDDLAFDSFCYEPENVYEKRMGSLYMIGALKNVLPQNIHFLDKLAKQIKEKFYKTVSVTPEKSLKETLKRANEYLEKIAQSGDVSWLGNLSFSAIALKNFELNFTKTGDLKIYLIRKGQIVDTDQKLDFGDLEPYPLKVFGNIVSGKLAENDIVLAVTKSMSEAFFQEKILSDIVKISLSPNLLEEAKKIKDVFNLKGEKLTKSTGAALIIVLSKDHLPKRRETLITKKAMKVLSIRETLAPVLRLIKLPSIKNFSFKLPKISLKSGKLKMAPPKMRMPEIVLPKKGFKIKLPKIPQFKINKRSALLPFLLVFLVLGYLIFQAQAQKKVEEYKVILEAAKENLQEAENYLVLSGSTPGTKEIVNTLLSESWNNLSPIFAKVESLPSGFAKDLLDTKKALSDHLAELSQFTVLDNPTLFFEFEDNEPKDIAHFNNEFYFSDSKSLYKINAQKELTEIESEKEIYSLASADDFLVLFSKPNILSFLENNSIKEKQSLASPFANYDFSDFGVYSNNLYFLDKDKIIKYAYSNSTWGSPQLWADAEEEFESIAIDGSVWLLNSANQIKRYYGGRVQKTISPQVFPQIQDIKDIYASENYLYLTEPSQKRIIVLDKNGNVIKQFQSESFNNISGLSFSGRTIHLLSGSSVYEISF